jgi:DNA-directed RNA polymerase specialized sigma24 family protein
VSSPPVDNAPERFQRFLAWLSSDAERAAHRYNELRAGLMRMFACRGCERPEELADEALDRVIRKVDVVAPGYEGNPAAYVHGVAKNVFLEYLRARRRSVEAGPVDLDVALRRISAPAADGAIERRHACLEHCLGTLAAEDRDLILRYYRQAGWAKIEERQVMADETRASRSALRKRTQRIRERLKACLSGCLEKGDA